MRIAESPWNFVAAAGRIIRMDTYIYIYYSCINLYNTENIHNEYSISTTVHGGAWGNSSAATSISSRNRLSTWISSSKCTKLTSSKDQAETCQLQPLRSMSPEAFNAERTCWHSKTLLPKCFYMLLRPQITLFGSPWSDDFFSGLLRTRTSTQRNAPANSQGCLVQPCLRSLKNLEKLYLDE